jgi:CRISPR system Cascade subunit CasE
MRYLSRLILDTRHRQIRRALGDTHQLHRAVLAAFPQAPDGASARQHFGLLYRAEPIEGTPALLRLLVQSAVRPDWTQLPAETLGPAPDERGNPSVRRVDEEYARIDAGTRLRFRLRANPTKTLSDRTPGREDRLLGKRVALLREEDQRDWLERKGGQHGFRLLTTVLDPELPAVAVAPQATERGRRPARDGERALPLCFGAVLFNGQLEVTDAELFRGALSAGIGSGKAFGFGLLSVAGLG